MFPEQFEYHIAPSINSFIDWLVAVLGPVFDGISEIVLSLMLALNSFFGALPWWSVLLVVALVSWYTTRRWITVISLSALVIMIGVFGFWQEAIDTFSVIVTAVVISVTIGIPLGILMSEVSFIHTALKPLLDAMQTMPSFVYLIPAMMLFGLGRVPAVMATLIYSLPPVARLTNLGLRQVAEEVEEAGKAYGATRWQLLKEIRLPMAMPSILAGINQTTMMALAMVVIASMIGAEGLGQEVLRAINRIDVGTGFEAGVSVVAMAIVIDRLTQGIAQKWKPPQSQS